MTNETNTPPLIEVVEGPGGESPFLRVAAWGEEGGTHFFRVDQVSAVTAYEMLWNPQAHTWRVSLHNGLHLVCRCDREALEAAIVRLTSVRWP